MAAFYNRLYIKKAMQIKTVPQNVCLHFLNRRHLPGDFMAAFIKFSGGFDPNPNLFFMLLLWPSLRGQDLIRCLRRNASISVRVVTLWNFLSTSIVTVSSVNSFKRQLDLAWNSLLPAVL